MPRSVRISEACEIAMQKSTCRVCVVVCVHACMRMVCVCAVFLSVCVHAGRHSTQTRLTHLWFMYLSYLVTMKGHHTIHGLEKCPQVVRKIWILCIPVSKLYTKYQQLITQNIYSNKPLVLHHMPIQHNEYLD